MNQLPSFEPIEQLFPQWLTARTIVEHTLPRALRFEMTSKDTLGVSLDWAQAIIDLAPPEDAQAVRERLNAAWGHASAVIDMQPLSVLYRQPANQESLHRADSILESQAQEMLAAGKPTPLQILSHFMGITPACGWIAISFGPDAITEQVRKEFEAWFLSVDHKPYGWLDHNGLERTASGECYTDGYVQGCWIGYQARIEAKPVISIGPVDFDRLYGQYPEPREVEPRQLVVKLGRPFMSGYTESGNHPATDLYSYDGVKSAIEAAGGTVKS